jgi:hypothetical protein
MLEGGHGDSLVGFASGISGIIDVTAFEAEEDGKEQIKVSDWDLLNRDGTAAVECVFIFRFG